MKEISILSEKSPSASSFPVSGAWGNPTPDGLQVIAHFFHEYPAVPSAWRVPVGSEGQLDFSQAEELKKAVLIREFVGTAVMSPETAVAVGNWLLTNAKAAMDCRKGKV